MLKTIVAVSAILVATGADAQALSCYEDPITAAQQCVNLASVKESQPNVRFAKIYSGGPKGVRETSFTIHTNCNTGVTHLKDRDGVSFAGGDGNETKAVRSLRGWMCSAPLPAAKKKKG